jgi:hypothetical protein
MRKAVVSKEKQTLSFRQKKTFRVGNSLCLGGFLSSLKLANIKVRKNQSKSLQI